MRFSKKVTIGVLSFAVLFVVIVLVIFLTKGIEPVGLIEFVKFLLSTELVTLGVIKANEDRVVSKREEEDDLSAD